MLTLEAGPVPSRNLPAIGGGSGRPHAAAIGGGEAIPGIRRCQELNTSSAPSEVRLRERASMAGRPIAPVAARADLLTGS